jgi:uncharacterized protein YceK
MTTALLSLAVVSCVLLSGCGSATDAKKEIPPGDGESGSGAPAVMSARLTIEEWHA